MTKITRYLVLAAALSMVGGCGGKQKSPARSGLGDGKVPPPPSVEGGDGGATNPDDISAGARADYSAVMNDYLAAAKSGFDTGTCSSLADRFRAVAQKHKLVEGAYMAGRSYHACGMKQEAEKAYQDALRINSAHARSLSNLGELYFAAGKVDGARKYWESAIQSDPKVTAARNNIAWLLIQEMRKTKDRGAWSRLEEEAKLHLSSVLAVDQENIKAYVLYGLLYMEGYERNRNRLDLAKLLLEEGEKRDASYPALLNAQGLLQLHRDNLGEALGKFDRAVELDPKFTEARLNVGTITLAFRKYDAAEEQFSRVLAMEPKNYDAMVGLGIAQRGQGKLDEAEASYKKAVDLEPTRGAAYFNLGVLYKDFRANRQSDLRASQEAYETSRKYFREFLSKQDVADQDKKEAQANIEDTDKIIKQLDEVIRASNQAGQS